MERAQRGVPAARLGVEEHPRSFAARLRRDLAASAPRWPDALLGSSASATHAPSKREKAKRVSCGAATSYMVASPSMAPSAMAVVVNSPGASSAG